MRKVGLDKMDVMMIFKRNFPDLQNEDPLLNTIARTVGEIIEQNNEIILKELASITEKR